MSWRKDRYDSWKKKDVSRQRFGGRDISQPATTDGRDLIFDRFVFRPHFFDGYRNRVDGDLERCSRTDEYIMQVAAHSMNDADIPHRLSPQTDFKLLVNMHIHDGEKEIPYGVFYIPIRRDRHDIMSGRICAITILDYSERFNVLLEKGKLS